MLRDASEARALAVHFERGFSKEGEIQAREAYARSLFQNRRLKKHIYIYIGCPGFRDFNFIPDRSFEQFRVNFFSAKTLVMSEM